MAVYPFLERAMLHGREYLAVLQSKVFPSANRDKVRHRRIRSLCIILTGIAVLLPAGIYALGAGRPQKAVKLAYKFIPGEVLTYKLVMDVNMHMRADVPNSGEMPGTNGRIVMVMREKTVKVLPNGDAEIAVSFGPMDVKMAGNAPIFPTDKLPSMTMVMSPNGQARHVTGVDRASVRSPFTEMMNLGNLGHALLPSKPVRIGDKWNDEISMPVGVGKMTVESALLSTDLKAGGHAVDAFSESINRKLDFTITTIAPPAAKGGEPRVTGAVRMTGNILNNGMVYFSAEQGHTIRTEGSGEARITISTPSGQEGKTENVSMNMETKLEMFLVPEKR